MWTGLTRFDEIVGDDLPYKTVKLEDVPEGFHFKDLPWDDIANDCPLMVGLKTPLCAFAELYYSDWEIVGKTYGDWFKQLSKSFMLNADTMEKMLAVYDEDIAKPLQSRTIKRTYDITDTNNGTTSNDGDSTSKDYELPINDTPAQEIARTVGTSGNTSTVDLTNKHTGSETEEWSDVGVAPNYVLLNGFLDNNRTSKEVFISYFKDNFTLAEGLTW